MSAGAASMSELERGRYLHVGRGIGDASQRPSFFDFEITFPIILIVLGGVLMIRSFVAHRGAASA